jgi:hypothetical protein
MIKLIALLSNVIFAAAFLSFFVGFYQQTVFIREWSEDHASHLDGATRSLF